MTNQPIKAITFDFWRTLFLARVNQKERRFARVELLCDAVHVSPERAKEALKEQEKEFLRIHVYEQRTLTPKDAIPLLESHLQIEISKDMQDGLASQFGEVILKFPPEPVEGALDAVKAAADHVPVGVIGKLGSIHSLSAEAARVVAKSAKFPKGSAGLDIYIILRKSLYVQHKKATCGDGRVIKSA